MPASDEEKSDEEETSSESQPPKPVAFIPEGGIKGEVKLPSVPDLKKDEEEDEPDPFL
jgi:hypothetical protein